MSLSRLSSPSTVTSSRKSSPYPQDAYFTDDQQEVGDELLPMEPEVSAAVNFLCDLMTKSSLDSIQVESFRSCLKAVMLRHYRNHWYPRVPLRGSAYRCLRINDVLDPLVAKAAALASLSADLVRSAFPVELSLWVDPGEVSVRFGEDGSIGVIHSCDPIMPADEEEPLQQHHHHHQQQQHIDAEEELSKSLSTISPELVMFHQQSPLQHHQHHHHMQQHSQYALEQMLQQHSPSAQAEPAGRYYRDMHHNGLGHILGQQDRDCTWSWNVAADYSVKSPLQYTNTTPSHRDYASLQQQQQQPIHGPSSSYNNVAAACPSPSLHLQGQPSQVDAASAQLSRHCRALAEQLVLNGGMLWSAANCGDNTQVMETVVN